MAENYGKKFEKVFSNCVKKVENTAIIRLPDQTMGYRGAKNICDFVIYHYPRVYLIECKTVKGVSLPFNNMSDKQWQGLLTESVKNGVTAGVICWFRKPDITMFIDINVLERWKQAGHKSLNFTVALKEPKETDVILLSGEKKRVYTDYNIEKFFQDANKGGTT